MKPAVQGKHRVGRRNVRRRGAAAILAMMFLVIFGSLAAAMAIVSQGNLTTADSQLKINRSLAGAETGMNWVIHRLNEAADNTITVYGKIDDTRAGELWMDETDGVRQQLYAAFLGEFHNLAEPTLTAKGLNVGPVAIGPGEPTFTVSFEPHPLPGPSGVGDFSNYDDPFYQRAPYNDATIFGAPVSSSNPLNARWIRVVVTCIDGPSTGSVTRSISIDFKLDKKLRMAVLSRSRIMVGRNVMIEGALGSRFTETNLANGHPIQMESDFRGLDTDLDDSLNLFVNTLALNDINGDNRINLLLASETSGISNPAQYDTDGDNYITDYDFFLAHFDADANGQISAIELGTSGDINRQQLMELIDTFGDPSRPGYGDGVIDRNDRYAKIRGRVVLKAGLQGWEDGAAGGTYQDFFQGPIVADHDDAPLTFDATDADLYSFEPDDFDTDTLEAMADGDLAGQATTQYANFDPMDPDSPNMDLSGSHVEAVPFQSQYPYDYYNRPVYENMTFENVRIPAGTNALFKNCTFIGVTYVETTQDNVDENFNYAGMQNADGSPKYPDMTVDTTDPATNGAVTIGDSKTVSNNIRFQGCTFEGAVVSDAPQAFTHTRNKLTFTGTTRFEIEESIHLDEAEKDLFRRSTILSPHYSVEMGTFVAPFDNAETVELSGTIVAGVVDMRGQVNINGSLITTFEPQSNTGPVLGETSPQFNTTLGYFSSASGDLEAELPTNGVGVIKIRYDPTIPMPDGISGPIEIKPLASSYYEGVAP